MKRFLDIILAIMIFPILILPAAIFVILSFLSTGKFPIISQDRMITLDKKPIRIYKIRTIKNSQESNILNSPGNIFQKNNLEQYVPFFCRWLRKSGMDEILQIYNILKGEMSFIGPRPLLRGDLEQMQKENINSYNRRSKITLKPGLTGYWQINCKRDKGILNLIEMDEYYENNKSFLLDFKIIIRSLRILLTASHSDSIVGKKESIFDLKEVILNDLNMTP